jgi:hypothetical protein
MWSKEQRSNLDLLENLHRFAAVHDLLDGTSSNLLEVSP